MTIGNSAFCFALYLTSVHFRGELQHVGDTSEQKFKCLPIKTREIGGVRLSEALHVKVRKCKFQVSISILFLFFFLCI